MQVESLEEIGLYLRSASEFTASASQAYWIFFAKFNNYYTPVVGTQISLRSVNVTAVAAAVVQMFWEA